MLAIDGARLVHIPPGVEHASSTKLPAHIDVLPETAAGGAYTVTAATERQPAGDTHVIVAVPVASPVTTPVVGPTIAIDVAPLLHVQPATELVNVAGVPIHILRPPLISGVAFIVTAKSAAHPPTV